MSFDQERFREVMAVVAGGGISTRDAAAALQRMPKPTAAEMAMLNAEVRRRGLDVPPWRKRPTRWWRKVRS